MSKIIIGTLLLSRLPQVETTPPVLQVPQNFPTGTDVWIPTERPKEKLLSKNCTQEQEEFLSKKSASWPNAVHFVMGMVITAIGFCAFRKCKGKKTKQVRSETEMSLKNTPPPLEMGTSKTPENPRVSPSTEEDEVDSYNENREIPLAEIVPTQSGNRRMPSLLASQRSLPLDIGDEPTEEKLIVQPNREQDRDRQSVSQMSSTPGTPRKLNIVIRENTSNITAASVSSFGSSDAGTPRVFGVVKDGVIAV